MADALSTLHGNGEGVGGDGGSGCGCVYHPIVGGCEFCGLALIECEATGCGSRFHHLCLNKHEKNL